MHWSANGLAIKVTLDEAYGMPPQAEAWFFRGGIAFAPIGSKFTARLHRYRSIFSTSGTSLFPVEPAPVVCALNTTAARAILQALNPGTHFEARDVNRVPYIPVSGSDEIVGRVERAFSEHEASREPSAEFRAPGPSHWRATQAWAQLAVGIPLMLGAYGWVLWHTGFGPEDRALFSQRRGR